LNKKLPDAEPAFNAQHFLHIAEEQKNNKAFADTGINFSFR